MGVAIYGILHDVRACASEPLVERLLGRVEYALPALLPVERCGGVSPKGFGICDRASVGFGIVHDRDLLMSVEERQDRGFVDSFTY